MNCTAFTALDIAQCAEAVNVGSLTEGTDWVLRVVNVATSRTEYIAGTGDIVIAGFDFAPSQVYALSLTQGTFKPFASEGNVGDAAVEMIYVKVVKVFDEDGEVYTPAEQWIILPA